MHKIPNDGPRSCRTPEPANMSHSVLLADPDAIVAQMSLEEKITLIGAPDWWNTAAIPRLGIPSIRMSDGPNGVRGSSHFLSVPGQCIPCGTSLAATFDTQLLHEVGEFLAEEAKIKAASMLLAPTINMIRNPRGGRSFECFSEDPHLSGMLAAAYVDGIQSKGIAACIKHFVANDMEDDRIAVDSVISPRALREIYLYPFMLAQKYAKPWAYMTAYGRLGGIHCAENKELLDAILRKEWGFDGIVISDWFGTYSVDDALIAGLDLEMPGPPRWRTSILVNHVLGAKKIKMEHVNKAASNMVRLVQKVSSTNREIVYGDHVERTRDTPEIRSFSRQLACEGIVLLKNEGGLLPARPAAVKRLAIIGPNAKGRVISGGGSAALKASYIVSPFDGLMNGLPGGIEAAYAIGCHAHKYLPTLEGSLKTPSGDPGWLCTFYGHDSEGCRTTAAGSFVLRDTGVKLNDFLPAGLSATWDIVFEANFTAEETCDFEFGLAVAGRAKLSINGEVLIDNWTKQTPGELFYGQGTVEEKATTRLLGGKTVKVVVQYTNTDPAERINKNLAIIRGLRLGGLEKIDTEKALQEATTLARQSDVVVFVGGLNSDWELEGSDRPTLALPGLQDELIRRLGEVNPKTVVVIQCGSAVAMPWIDSVAGVVQGWLLGNEVGNALADVIYGKVNPSGRLPLTFPKKMEAVPSHNSFVSENTEVHYREDLFMGYKHYRATSIEPLFPFGFGLSYTTFSLSELAFSSPRLSNGGEDILVNVSVTVTNTGTVTGSDVVQVYVALPDVGITTPASQLKGFAKVRDLAPGKCGKALVTLEKFAFAFWDVPENRWKIVKGPYQIDVGRHSMDTMLRGTVHVEHDLTWRGL